MTTRARVAALALAAVMVALALWIVAGGAERGAARRAPAPIGEAGAPSPSLPPAASRQAPQPVPLPGPVADAAEVEPEHDPPPGSSRLVVELRGECAGADVRLELAPRELESPPGIPPPAHGPVTAGPGQVLCGLRLGPYARSPLRPPPRGEAPSSREGSTLVWTGVRAGAHEIVAAPDSDMVPARPAVVQARAGATTHAVVELLAAGAVQVRLVLPSEAPLSGAHVRLIGPLPDGFAHEDNDPQWLVGTVDGRLRADAEGRAELRPVAIGTRWLLHAWDADGAHLTAVVVARPATEETIVLVASTAFPLEVTVVDAFDGRGIAGAEVGVIDWRLNALRGAPCSGPQPPALRGIDTTDEHGRVRVRAEPGAWLFVARSEYGWATVRPADDALRAGRLTVGLDHPRRGLMRVTRADGTPVAGAEVSASWDGFAERNGAWSEGELGSAVSALDGTVPLPAPDELPDVETGRLVLRAEHARLGSGCVDLPLELVRRGAATAARNIVLEPGGDLAVDFAATGWPAPRTRTTAPTLARLREHAEWDATFLVTLRYLGSTGPRWDYSSRDGERRSLIIDADPARASTVLFEDLAPGLYGVWVEAPGRALELVPPAVEVRSGRTSRLWVAPPAPQWSGRVTVDLGAHAAHVADAAHAAHRHPDRSPPQATLVPVADVPPPQRLFAWMPPHAGRDRVARAPVLPGEPLVFECVPPGRFAVRVAFPGAGDDGATVRASSAPFDLGPGEHLVVPLE